MRERVKTILLFLLVFSSIYMTQKLWMQLPNQFLEDLSTNEAFSKSYVLSDMITPNKYLLNFGNTFHTILYYESQNSIWENSRAIVASILGSEDITIDEITKDQYLKFQEERSLVLYLPEQMNTYILAKMWNVKTPNDIADTIPNINEIYIYLGSKDPFFVFSDNTNFILVQNSSINNTLLKNDLTHIKESGNYNIYYSMREGYGIESDIYIPSEMKTTMPEVYVSNVLGSLDEDAKDRIAERFLDKSIDYIREIVEGNGSTFYVLNDKSLKLNANGTLEYFQPLEEKVTERNLYTSLSTVAEFITKKESTIEGMYLESIDEIESDSNEGYRLTFKYRISGIPVLLGNRDVDDYIEIEVFNNHIRSYKQLTRREMNQGINTSFEHRPLLSFDVLDKNYEFLVKEYLIYNNSDEVNEENIRNEVLGAIEDITLSYYDPNLKDKSEKLIGVWAIKLNGKTYAFNAYTGNLVFEK